ncbi:MAG TPA: hypothetical protein VE398_21420 [Acidobacteriota bacterium]|nr:hypothetical protein [Acidobacteriota bacterium]
MKSKTSAAMLLMLTFLLGGITGSVSYSLYQNHVAAATPKANNPHDPVNDLARALSLDALQRETLKNIMDQSRGRYHALSQQIRPQYEAIRNETRQQIRQILRDDQKTRFEEFLKDVDRRHKEREARSSQ